MSCCWSDNSGELDLITEVRRKLEKMRYTKERIPRISGRPAFYESGKNSEFYNKKFKKTISRSSSLHDSLLNLDEQVKTNQNILNLQNKYGLTIVQKNGQRKLGGPPPGWIGPPPGPGCEIFVGRIPRTIYEDVIYPIFREIGEIYEMRLMMNFSGTNRGFCFIMYGQPQFAQQAIKQLNNYEIRPGWFIGVVESINNCRLHVTELPAHTVAATLIKRIWSACEDIDKISVFTNLHNAHIKHALISFKTHRGAAMARRRLLPERNNFFDKSEVRIEWAHPRTSITNVIEEKGVCDESGHVLLTKTVIGSEKKCFNEEYSHKVPSKQGRKKRPVQNSSKSKTLNVLKSEENHLQNSSFKNNYESILNDNFIQSHNMNQSSIYEQGVCDSEDIFNDSPFKTRSDESLSDFSKTSDSDISKNDSNNSLHYCSNATPAFLNPRNCSVLHFPWNIAMQYGSSNSHVNIAQQSNSFNIPFPWKAMMDNFHAAMPVMHNSSINLNIHVPEYCNNKFNYEPNGRLYYEVIRNARPILNRNVSLG